MYRFLIFNGQCSLGFVVKELLAALLAVDATKELLHLDLALQLHQGIEHSLRTRRTARQVDVDRDNLVDALYHAVAVLEGSTAHGAGRVLSRSQAKKDYTPEQITEDMESRGIKLKATSKHVIAEEAPGAYFPTTTLVPLAFNSATSWSIYSLSLKSSCFMLFIFTSIVALLSSRHKPDLKRE